MTKIHYYDFQKYGAPHESPLYGNHIDSKLYDRIIAGKMCIDGMDEFSIGFFEVFFCKNGTIEFSNSLNQFCKIDFHSFDNNENELGFTIDTVTEKMTPMTVNQIRFLKMKEIANEDIFH